MRRMLSCLGFGLVVALVLSSERAWSWPGEDLVGSGEVAKMQEASPDKARVEPKRARKLQIMGEKTGAYSVVVSSDVGLFTSAKLKAFDAICFNNTTAVEKALDGSGKKALLGYIKNGGGIVGIHGATDCFMQWPEMAEIMGGLFDQHPWNEEVTLKIDDPMHPLCQVFGGKSFVVADEIYQIKAPYSRERLRVLLSLDTAKTNMNKGNIRRTDGDFAVAWVRSYGKGRVFYCSLGHRHEIFWNPTVLQFYLDGIQFALGDLEADTTPSAKLDPAYQERGVSEARRRRFDGAFEDIKGYDVGQSRKGLMTIAETLRESGGNAAQRQVFADRLAGLLGGEGSVALKQFVCRMLSQFGSAGQVGALAPLLTDKELAHMARYALERIDAPAAGRVLRQALGKTKGELKVGVINSIGEREDAEAIGVLSDLVKASDASVAEASVLALGKMGGAKVAKRLLKLRRKGSVEMRGVLADACLRIADRLSGEGRQRSARKIYRALYKADEEGGTQAAAFIGLVHASKTDEAVGYVVAGLGSEDVAVQQSALRLVRELPGEQASVIFAKELQGAPAGTQVFLIDALAARGDVGVLPAVVEAARDGAGAVQVAALRALGQLGDASVVELLVERAAHGAPEQVQVARESLHRLSGGHVDPKMIQLLETTDDPQVTIALIESLSSRKTASAFKPLVAIAGKPASPPLGVAAWRALGEVASGKEMSELVGLLVEAKDRDRSVAEKTVVAVARKAPASIDAAGVVLKRIEGVTETKVKSSLLRVLAQIGDVRALDLMRTALGHEDLEMQEAALRGLASWPNTDPIADLLKVAQKSSIQKLRVLALRGYVGMIALAQELSPEERLGMYKMAMGLAETQTEKRRVIGSLAALESPVAIAYVKTFFEDEALETDAKLAAVKIAQRVYPLDPAGIGALMKQLEESSNEQIRKQSQGVLAKLGQLGDFITAWKVAGPYVAADGTDKGAFDSAFGPEQAGAAVAWQTIALGTAKPGHLNLAQAFGSHNHCAGYLRTVVHSGKTQELDLLVGSDDSVKVWLNGKLVHAHHVGRAVVVDQDKVRVTLNEGANTLLLKVVQFSGDWGAVVRFRKADGQAVDNLRFVLP